MRRIYSAFMSKAKGLFAGLLDHITADIDMAIDHEADAADRSTLRRLRTAPPSHQPMAEAYTSCAAHLHWNQSYANEQPSAEMEYFWSNYTYATVAIPTEGVFPPGPYHAADGFALYLVCQGADLVYPEHHHPAVEVYGIVSGTGNWMRGGEGQRLRQPGSVFVHQSSMGHATTTNAEPTISWAAWLDDVTTPAAFSDPT